MKMGPRAVFGSAFSTLVYCWLGSNLIHGDWIGSAVLVVLMLSIAFLLWKYQKQVLHLAAEVPEGCTAVGIRAHDFVPCDAGAPNALPVAALSSSENPFDWNLICTAPDGTARLWWKVSKSTLFSPAPVPPHFLCAAPESIMPLTN